MLNGLRTPSGSLIVCDKQPAFALGLLLHRLCTGTAALVDYPHAWQVGLDWSGGVRGYGAISWRVDADVGSLTLVPPCTFPVCGVGPTIRTTTG